MSLLTGTVSRLGGESAFAELEELNLEFASLSDVQMVSGFKKLRHLKIGEVEHGDLEGLSALKNPDIATYCHTPSRPRSAGALSNLTELSLIDSRAQTDIRWVAGCPSLRFLASEIAIGLDLSPLKHLPYLETLILWLQGDTDLSPLEDITSLKQLNC